MCGIFAYLNYCVPRERRYVLEVLLNGLRRLEYRGYDSSGIALDADLPPTGSAAAYAGTPPLVFRQEGKIENLVRSVYSGGYRPVLPPCCNSFQFRLFPGQRLDLRPFGRGF
jgi:glucosamine--fructose-6-phosphate aminotransferase (isomerizing)